LRVLYLHQYFATPSSNGGTRSYHIAKALIDKGHEVEFITSSAFVPKDWLLTSGWNKINHEGIHLNILKQPYSNRTTFFRRIVIFLLFAVRSTFKAASTPCDLVYATSTPLSIAIPGVLASKIRRVKLVFEVRDLWPTIPVAMKVIRSRPVIFFSRILERWAYRNSDAIVALSPGMALGIAEALEPINPISVIPNFSDVRLFQDGAGQKGVFEQSCPWIGGRKLVVYAGTFGTVNNLSYLIDVAYWASKSDKSVCFLLIGGIFNENVYFLGPMPKRQLAGAFAAAHILVSTILPISELAHNSANKFFDALAAGKPIAINHLGWQAEIISEHGIGVLMNPLSAQQGASSLLKFINNASCLDTASIAALALAKTAYSVEVLTDQAVTLVESLIKKTDG